MKKLIKYIQDNGINYVPWAEEHKINPATVWRLINGKGGISYKSAVKISRATKGEIGVVELLEGK